MNPHYISLNPLISWTKEERPLEWDRFFGRSAPLHVEIGSGLGDFLVQSALAEQEKNFLGIEIGWVPIRRTLRKIALSGAHNVRLIQADAQIAFERLIPPESIRRVASLFPCPWPKKKHVKKRLFSRYFLKILNSRLVHSGGVMIVTDHSGFFRWILSQTSETGMEIKTEMIEPGFKTKYEKKWVGLGQKSFFKIILTKTKHIDIPLKEDIPLITHRSDHFDPGSFRPAGVNGEIVVEFKKFLFDTDNKTGMIRCIVYEGNLLQDFWIEIARGEKCWHIRPAKGCGLIPTQGAQRALDLVRDSI